MKGSTTVFDIGTQLEFFPLSIRDFAAGAFKVAPFISLGLHWVSYDPEAYSDLGCFKYCQFRLRINILMPFNKNPEIPGEWLQVLGFAIKYLRLSDLMLDSRWQYYFSNWVDGLNPSFENNQTRRST